MAGPLGVSHLVVFNQTDAGVNMRIARCPRGPTCTFRVNKFALCNDILHSQRRPRAPGGEYNTHPLVSSSRAECMREDRPLTLPLAIAARPQQLWRRSPSPQAPRIRLPEPLPAHSSADHAPLASTSRRAALVQRPDRNVSVGRYQSSSTATAYSKALHAPFAPAASNGVTTSSLFAQ